MSYRNNRNNRNNRNGRGPRTPYCKVCHDAGKSREEYTSHWVKDRPGPSGRVVCPYLLSLECRYCHKTGHTPKGCPELAAKGRLCRPVPESKKEEDDGFETVARSRRRGLSTKGRSAERKEPVKKEAELPQRTKNAFEGLMEDSESDYETEEVTEYPAISAAVQTAPQLSGWAAIAAKRPAPIKVTVTVAPPPLKLERQVAHMRLPQEELQRDESMYNPDGTMKSWADLCDSDDEDKEGVILDW